MTRRTSAKQRVLDALLAAGGGGQTTAQLCQPAVGGERFGARIHELRQAGHEIRERRLAPGSSLYTIVGVAAGPAALRSPVAGDGLRAAGGTGRETDDRVRRVDMCPRCAYATVTGPVCPAGHDTVSGWEIDLRPPVEYEMAAAA
ncbi:MAG: hypothetical protein JWM47_4568 [Acidimicrobiales bacterium]|nr:hypothetical protein [Acidimicrobiales bacterium]